MSQENVKIVRRYLHRAQEIPDAAWDIFDEAVEWEVGIFSLPDSPSSFHGPNGVRDFFRHWVGPFEDWGYSVEELIDGQEVVAVRIHQWGRGKGSGATVELRFWQVWSMRDGKAVRVSHHLDKAEALEAAGLSDQDAHADS
jgi:ketosteroid isomerase-like protein